MAGAPDPLGGNGDSLAPWVATVDGHVLTPRLGNFPAEPMYTLVVDGVDVRELESFPENWTRGTGR